MIAEVCIDALEVSVLAHAGHANQHFRERSSTRPEQNLREDTTMLGFSAATVPTGPRLERLDDVVIDVADDKISHDGSPVRVENDSDCNAST
ncbi:MAG: hypothetical protein H0T87_11325 [Gammaproteobacteria bacterium]|nr:hypothetical protein [Gammaproteobacteria bacterium]